MTGQIIFMHIYYKRIEKSEIIGKFRGSFGCISNEDWQFCNRDAVNLLNIHVYNSSINGIYK